MAPPMMSATSFVILILLIQTSSTEDMNELIKSIFSIPLDSVTTTKTVPVPPPKGKYNHSYKPCGRSKVCVLEYLCQNGKVDEDGGVMIDIRFGGTNCPFLETCCAVGDIVEEPIVRPIDKQTGCGYRNKNGVGFTIAALDSESDFGEFPWMIVIMREETTADKVTDVYHCGGSLITPKVVLTAAHRTRYWSTMKLKARAGEWEINTKVELIEVQERQVVDVIAHERYHTRNLYNDVALMFLDTPFELTASVNTVCLPPAIANFDYARCFATGWGKDQFHNGHYQNVLKKIELPVVPHAKCQVNLRNAFKRTAFNLHSSFICAGGERGKDACTGDGGSPLVCPIANRMNRFYQVGIVAWGIGCGQENIPGVYASVPNLRAWIDEQLEYKQINSSYFHISNSL